jgi:hypothetical protein
MKTKKIILLILISFFNYPKINVQDFDARDIDGMWERNDGVRIQIQGTAVFAEGSNALIFAVGNSGWPISSIRYNYKFQNIKHNGDNTWKAGNYAYSKANNGWISSGNAILVMSMNKEEFTFGGFTYFRK